MKQEVKEDWIINNKNMFGLPKFVDLSISSIQFEILNQVKGKKFKSISDYLMFEINLSNEIRLTNALNIEIILKDHLELNFNPLGLKKLRISMILGFIQLSLLKKYYGENCNNILTFSTYQLQYEKSLSTYLESNIDTDEEDFIKSELKLCEDLNVEIEKSIYSTLSPLGDVIDKPCDFKKNLINSLDKRQKYLERKLIIDDTPIFKKNRPYKDEEAINLNFIVKTKLLPDLIMGFVEHGDFFDDFLKTYKFNFVSRKECEYNFSTITDYLELKINETNANQVKYSDLFNLKEFGISAAGIVLLLAAQGVQIFTNSNLLKLKSSLSKFSSQFKPLPENDVETPVLISENFNADDFSFGADLLVKPKEEFTTFLVERYGEKYSKDELGLIVDNYYGGKKNTVRMDAPKKIKINSYIKSVYVYSVFKKCMSDKESNIYYNTLIQVWDESCRSNIEKNNLRAIDQNLALVFNSYLSKILGIYRHAYEYRENESLKSLNIIDLKEYKFIMLMNEQTDHFVHHLKQQKIIGNYLDLIKRKDYVLGLFHSLETFLVNASINFSKSPFVEVFKESKDKIKNCISFEEIKFLATSTEPKPISQEQKNLKIAFEIVGENNSRTKSIMYHHIPEVLERYSLNNNDAKNILLTASGGFHPETQSKIIPKIVEYLKEVGINLKTKNEVGKELPITFEELFYNTKNAEVCLNILRELEPKVIDGLNNYIGKAKGIFPLWVQVLKTFNPQPLIKHFPDKIYKDLLNKKINGLNLSKDASEFRKTYKRLVNNNIELDIKTILSQYSQDGKLGK